MSDQSVVLLFSGQGAQAVGMGKDLLPLVQSDNSLVAQADEILGWSLSEVMFAGPMEELTRTSRCQPALYVHGLLCLKLLQERVPNLKIVGTAGLSLGEFTAHTAAGTFDFESGLNLVAKRGRYMEQATDATEGAMAAMIGGDEAAVVALAAECGVDVANYNAPGQIVLSGAVAGIEMAVELAKSKGIKLAKKLPVAGAYHSRMMQSAQEKLAEELKRVSVQEPSVPVVCNVEAREVKTQEEILATLEAQVTGSVRWTESMKVFLEKGETQFIELGPGGVLAGLMRRIDRSASVLKVEDAGSLEAVVEALRA
ncbi:MAG: ACP S-malonyltransferase [Verrucomicrobiales bacterium]|nr:ACP S-malonyltransferase [Verrucomicrobiales bacterium]